MCWSPTASLVFGVAGVAGAAYAEKQKKPHVVSVTMLYFSVMEFLQFFSYFSLDQCSLQSNSTLTLLSYLHIAFQPIFIAACMMSLSGKITAKGRRVMYGVALFCTGLMLIRLIPLFPAALCPIGSTMCGRVLCTLRGNWHLAWSVPQYVFPVPGDLYLYHAVGSFAVPLWYREWKAPLMIFLSGPALAFLLTGGNPLEWPSVWCLSSSVLLLYCVFWMPAPFSAPTKR